MKVIVYYIVPSLWLGLFFSALTAKKLSVPAAEIPKHLHSPHYTVRFLTDEQERQGGSWFIPRKDLGSDSRAQLSLTYYYFLNDTHQYRATETQQTRVVTKYKSSLFGERNLQLPLLSFAAAAHARFSSRAKTKQ